jgi:Holliday junction resolvase RusA-like endonuclease
MMHRRSDGYWYSIEGINPEPWEAPEGSAFRRKGGGFGVQMHSPERLRFYKQSIAEEFVAQNPEYVNLGDMMLDVTFYLWRNVPEFVRINTKGNSGQGNLVDATNCQKSLEDALQSLLYNNDINNRSVQTWMVEQGTNVESFILINVNFGGEVSNDVIAMRQLLTSNETKQASNFNELGADRDIF